MSFFSLYIFLFLVGRCALLVCAALFPSRGEIEKGQVLSSEVCLVWAFFILLLLGLAQAWYIWRTVETHSDWLGFACASLSFSVSFFWSGLGWAWKRARTYTYDIVCSVLWFGVLGDLLQASASASAGYGGHCTTLHDIYHTYTYTYNIASASALTRGEKYLGFGWFGWEGDWREGGGAGRALAKSGDPGIGIVCSSPEPMYGIRSEEK